ncbi:MAG: translation elongation factor Ts [Planctomycetes bacterium]|nr:translation elongation factor Ts [Planctomycetota bacterium]
MMAITAEEVKKLREKTGLPLMDCKKALTESSGDFDGAIRWLRENGVKIQTGRADRVTEFGRFGLFFNDSVGAMVELKCESAPVTQNDAFIALARDLAERLATGSGAASADDLLAQPSPGREGSTLKERKDELFNRIREVFNVGRMVRFDGRCAGYLHMGSVVHGVLVQATGGTPEQLKDICMHIAAMAPSALTVDELDRAVVDNERSILREAALKEGKPVNIVDKMVEGRLKTFYAERVLLEQPFVKDSAISVGAYAKQAGIVLRRFAHQVLGRE